MKTIPAPMKLPFARSPAGLFVTLAASLFVAELVVMFLLETLPPLPPLLTAVLDATILVVLIFPALLAFSFRPLLRQIQARNETDKQLRAVNRTLEQRVRERTHELQTANQSLRESEDRFAGAFQHAPIGVALASPEGRWLKVNRALCDLLGYSEAELLARTAGDLTHPEDIEPSLDNVRRVLAGGSRSFQIEKRYVHRDGHFITVLSSISLVCDAQGQPCYCIDQIQDITEHKRAEAIIRRERDFSQAALDSLPGLFYLFDDQGRFLRWNQNLEKVSGYSADELSRMTPSDLFDRTDKGRIVDAIQQAFQAGKVTVEADFVSKDQTRTPFFFTGKLFHFEQKSCVMGMGIDITERKRAADVLRESEQRFRILFEQAIDGMLLADAETKRFTLANNQIQLMLGYSEAELLRLTVTDIHPAADLPAVLDQFERQARGEISLITNIPMRRKDGSVFYADISASAVRLQQRDGLFGIFRDITERKQAELKLEQVNKQLQEASRQAGMAEVATGILHNVGNVLNSVNIASACVADSIQKSKAANLGKVVGLLREHEANLGDFLTVNPQGRQIPVYLAQLAEHLVEEQTAALKELANLQKNIEHIKDIIAMQQGFAKVSGITELLSVADLVEDALKMNASALARHDIQIRREFQAVPLLLVEKHQVLQILVNLVRNAIQACSEANPSEKKITLRITRGPEVVRIAVTDNGIGIPTENLTRLFAHGFTTKKTGHGFGLHSAALAAQDLGGSLTVHSDGPGQGATFTLELPCLATPAPLHHFPNPGTLEIRP